MIALFEIVALPFMIIKTKFDYLAYTFSFFILVIGFFCFFYIKKQKKRERRLGDIKGIINNYFFFLPVFTMILIVTCLCAFLYHEDDDDGYYISISNIAVEENRIEFANDYVYNGTEEEGGNQGFQPPIVSWELFIAYLSRMFQIAPVVIYHTILPLILIPFCFAVIYNIGKSLFKDKERVAALLFFYVVLNIFSGYLVRSPGCFLFLRIWQGKALLANLVFPMMLYQQIEDYEHQDEKVAWVRKLMIMISGGAFSIVGIYLVPICYIVLEFPYLVWLIINKDKKIRKVIKIISIFAVPALFIGGGAFLYVISTSSGLDYWNKEPVSWKVWYLVTIGTWDKGYMLLYIISVITILFLKQKRQVFLLIFPGVCLFLSFLNPLFSDFISQKITGVDVYWRLWWILPMYITIAVAFSNILPIFMKVKKQIFIFCSVLLVYFLGVNIFQRELFFDSYRNLYKLPNEIIYLSDYMLEKRNTPSVLFEEDLSPKVRQYTSRISVPIARGMPDNESLIKGTDVSYEQLYNAIYNNYNVTKSSEEEALKMLNVDYIVVANRDLRLRKDSVYKKEQDFGVYRIYSKEGILE
ncbi:MAG: hypothetical protein HFI78_00345 [Lachnospiraceae bacterium]|nr:hypothetical protein [Lachnospiraceae bacterium]